MGLFGNKNDRKLVFLGGHQFVANDEYVKYTSMFGKTFRVLRKDIESVSLDKGGMGKNKVKVNGKGTVLAEVELPRMWAEKAQDFIRNEALGGSSEQSSNSGVGDLEKLADLKKKVLSRRKNLIRRKNRFLDFNTHPEDLPYTDVLYPVLCLSTYRMHIWVRQA